MMSYYAELIVLALSLTILGAVEAHAVGETTTVTVCTGKVDPSKPGPQC